MLLTINLFIQFWMLAQYLQQGITGEYSPLSKCLLMSFILILDVLAGDLSKAMIGESHTIVFINMLILTVINFFAFLRMSRLFKNEPSLSDFNNVSQFLTN
jgi:hypothetical protein